MRQAYPVIGVDNDLGIQLRLELRDLEAKPIQFSLFIQALNKIVGMNDENEDSPNYMNKPNSWWQMGAMHGVPYIPWSGDPNAPAEDGSNSYKMGYCYHSSTLFPTWHRVSVLLFEQAVVNEAITIATDLECNNSAARCEKWLNAAKTLRFPFWDWTKPDVGHVGIPKVCQEKTVSIAVPGGACETVCNPLHHYQYAGKPGFVENVTYMEKWKRTYRWANRNENPTEELYEKAFDAFVNGGSLLAPGFTEEIKLTPVNQLRENVAALFKCDLDSPCYGSNIWGYFASTAGSTVYQPPGMIVPPSLEETHNDIHLLTGGNGTMSVNEYAGFDPIFFLHHCNVDRLYAFWEYLYPNYWMSDGWRNEKDEIIPFTNVKGTYWQKPDSAINNTTPLQPFLKADLNYWNSDDTRGLLDTSPVRKYYTYPPIVDCHTKVEVNVNVPYDTTNLKLREQYQLALHREWSGSLTEILETHQAVSRASDGALSQHIDLLLTLEDNLMHLRRFVVVGLLREFAFPGSHRLELYLAPESPQGKPIVVGSISVLARADPSGCPACQDRLAAGHHIRGTMHIDPRVLLHLLARLNPDQLATIKTLDDMAVVIQGGLQMRIVQPDGTPLAEAVGSGGTADNSTPLDEAKAPRLTLQSHVASHHLEDVHVPIKHHSHTVHGEVGDRTGWKVF